MLKFRSFNSLDKLAITLIILLTLMMGLLIMGGTACGDECLFHAGAKVNSFSWQERTLGSQDRAFILGFNRPMDRLSVEENLAIAPPLPGKISWSGLRLAYTLDQPIPYGEEYQITLSAARERFPNQEQAGAEIQPFKALFSSRDRALAYIGTEGKEQGRLVVYNFTRQQSKILTPPNLVVFEFKPYPQGDRLLFSASDRTAGAKGLQQLQLYSVSTEFDLPENTSPEIKLILDNQTYQNNKFDLAQDGKTIVVQRLNRNQPQDYGLWQLSDRQPPELITSAQVGDFLITPDSQTVAVAQGEGISLLPLETEAEPIDFLSRYGQVIDFSPDGTGAVMVDFHTDDADLRYTQSLVYVSNQGKAQELLNTDGSIQNCQFSPTAQDLYCWLTELEKGEIYAEKPYLAEINLESAKVKTIVQLPNYQESKLSVAPDGLGILFEKTQNNQAPTSANQQNTIWLYLPSGNTAESLIQPLPLMGFHPQWLP
ncbi:MAG: hypothetical protein AAFQ80_13940 [Cyanobacteria bacterium J06621_8]